MPPLSGPFLDCLTLTIEALCSSEMSLIIYQLIQYTIPEDLNSQFFLELKPYHIYMTYYTSFTGRQKRDLSFVLQVSRGILRMDRMIKTL